MALKTILRNLLTAATTPNRILVATLLLLSATPSGAAWIQVRATPPPVPPAQSEIDRDKNIPPVRSVTKTDRSIPLSIVADQARELDGLLVEISRQLRSIQEIITSDGWTDTHVTEIRQRLLFVDSLVSGVPTPTELRNEYFYWDTLSKQNGTFRKILSSRAVYLED